MTTHTTRTVPTLLATLSIGLLSCLFLAGCGKRDSAAAAPGESGAPGASAAGAAARVYVVGTDAAYAPFESQNEKGQIVGFDIDVASAVAQKAGIALRFVNTPWEGIFNALAQGDRDIVVSAVTITPERQATMDFSDPYFDAQQLIAVKAGSNVATFAALKTLKVGVQTGTTGDEAVSKLQGKTSANIRRFESTPLALQELQAGGVDAVVADNGVINHHVLNNPGGGFKTVADPAFVPERYGMAVRKGDTALRDKLNLGLAGIQADGSYAAIQRKYFGAGTATTATPATTATTATTAATAAAPTASAPR